MAYMKARKASTGQKIVFTLAIIFSLPFSLIFLFFWRGRCVYCGKRILFNKRVCKKCYRNATSIVNDFEGKMETFYAQMGSIEGIDDILSQYQYILDRIGGIEVIYDALDDKIDANSMSNIVLDYLAMNLDSWYKTNENQLLKNLAYRQEVITLINEAFVEYEQTKHLLVPYLEKIQALETQ